MSASEATLLIYVVTCLVLFAVLVVAAVYADIGAGKRIEKLDDHEDGTDFW